MTEPDPWEAEDRAACAELLSRVTPRHAAMGRDLLAEGAEPGPLRMALEYAVVLRSAPRSARLPDDVPDDLALLLRALHRAQFGAAKRRRTHCKHGHPFDEANTFIYRGYRECRACGRERKRPPTFSGGNAGKTHCPRGHAYDEANTRWESGSKGPSRRCRACRRDHSQERSRRRRAARPPRPPRPPRTHCKHGHPFDEANTRRRLTRAGPECRTCGRERQRPPTFFGGNGARTHCKHGHPFDEANTYWGATGGRQCRACGREQARQRRARARLGLTNPAPAAAHVS